MIKKIIKLIPFFILFIICLNIVLAKVYIEDDGDLISDSTERKIEKSISELDTKYATDIRIVIKTIENYADQEEFITIAKSVRDAYSLRTHGDTLYNLLLMGVKETRRIKGYWLIEQYSLKDDLKYIVESGTVRDYLDKQNFDSAFDYIITQYAEAVQRAREGKLSLSGVEVSSWQNVKDESKYSKKDKQVFLVPNANNWRAVLSAVPVAVWYDKNKGLKEYPLLIVHEERTGYDFSPIFSFLAEYHAEEITSLDPGLSKLLNLIESEKISGAEEWQEKGGWRKIGEGIVDILSWARNKIIGIKPARFFVGVGGKIEGFAKSTWGFFASFWSKEKWYVEFWDKDKLKDIVVVDYGLNYYDENDREIAFTASSFASFINAPLFFLSRNNFKDVEDYLIGRRIYVIGTLDREVMDYIEENCELTKWSLEDVKEVIQGKIENPAVEALDLARLLGWSISKTSVHVEGMRFNIFPEELDKLFPDEYFDDGNDLEEQNKLDEALEAYKKAYETGIKIKDWYSFISVIRAANIHFRRGEYEEAKNIYLKAHQLKESKTFRTLYILGGIPDIKICSKVDCENYKWMEKTGAEAILQYRIAETYEKLKDYDMAIKEYKEVTRPISERGAGEFLKIANQPIFTYVGAGFQRLFEFESNYGAFVPAMAYEKLGDLYKSIKEDEDRAKGFYNEAFEIYLMFKRDFGDNCEDKPECTEWKLNIAKKKIAEL